jgi:hypothetical protein
MGATDMVDGRSSDATAGQQAPPTEPATSRPPLAQFLQQLEARLTGDRLSEQALPPLASFSLRETLAEYLRLPAAELDALPPLVHAWLLNELYAFPTLIDDALPGAVCNLYFHCGGSSARPLVIEALLYLDAFRSCSKQQPGPSSVSAVWQAIEEDRTASPEDRYRMAEELLDLLIDQYANESPDVAAVLRQFVRDQRDRHPDDPRIAARVRLRAEQLGGEYGSRLRQIVGL